MPNTDQVNIYLPSKKFIAFANEDNFDKKIREPHAIRRIKIVNVDPPSSSRPEFRAGKDESDVTLQLDTQQQGFHTKLDLILRYHRRGPPDERPRKPNLPAKDLT